MFLLTAWNEELGVSVFICLCISITDITNQKTSGILKNRPWGHSKLSAL